MTKKQVKKAVGEHALATIEDVAGGSRYACSCGEKGAPVGDIATEGGSVFVTAHERAVGAQEFHAALATNPAPWREEAS